MSEKSSLTYVDLQAAMELGVQNGKILSVSLPNQKSALRAFLRYLGLSERSSIGSTLRASYYKNLNKHIQILIDEGRGNSYIANRKHLLGKWNSLVLKLDKQAAAQANTMTPFQESVVSLIQQSKVSVAELARNVGISKATLRRWQHGGQPNLLAVPSIRRLESFFGLHRDLIVNQAFAHRLHVIKSPVEEMPKIAYRERLRVQRTDHYRLKECSITLRDEWRDFVTHKTERFPELKRYSRGVWVKTAASTKVESEDNWYCFAKGFHVPTAGIAWERLMSFLGWLARPKSSGGYGIPVEDVQTIAWMTNKTAVHKYVKWVVERADDKLHGGVSSFIAFVGALTHPVHGYVTQMPSLQNNFSEGCRPMDWSGACNETYSWAREMKKGITENGQEKSRNPFDPIRDVLELPSPMDAVVDMVLRLKANKPTTGGELEAIWARDVLLVKIMASNPLRAKNIKLLTYKRDNKGHVYRRADGAWYIKIDKTEFKNMKGAARKRDYDMPIDKSIWSDLERYLDFYRPMLPHAEKLDFVFLSSSDEPPKNSNGAWVTLNRRVEVLTKKYLWKCPGVGAHSFRYIFGTAFLKANPGDWDTAALCLHDEVTTVKQHYAHLRSQDGGERAHRVLAGAFLRM